MRGLRQRVTSAVLLLGIVAATIVGLDGWADAATTQPSSSPHASAAE